MKASEAYTILALNLGLEIQYDDPSADYCSAMDFAIRAIEKQIVRPPEYKVRKGYESLGRDYYCKCGAMFIDWRNQPTNYCGNCGQKIREVPE